MNALFRMDRAFYFVMRSAYKELHATQRWFHQQTGCIWKLSFLVQCWTCRHTSIKIMIYFQFRMVSTVCCGVWLELSSQYLPDLPTQMTSEQLSNDYLHCNGGDRVFHLTIKFSFFDSFHFLTNWNYQFFFIFNRDYFWLTSVNVLSSTAPV